MEDNDKLHVLDFPKKIHAESVMVMILNIVQFPQLPVLLLYNKTQ